MQKFFTKYAAAAHLALVSVAPLVLLPFIGSEQTATVILWLSAFAMVWAIVQPSCLRGESASTSSKRVLRSIATDPLFWFSLVALALAIFRTVNSGIGCGYDPVSRSWSLKGAEYSLLPGCVKGAGFLPCATVAALVVVMQGCAHSLGRAARASYLLVATLISGASALSLYLMALGGNATALSYLKVTTLSPHYLGIAYGVWLVGAVALLFEVIEQGWMKAELAVFVAIIGNASGLFLYSPLPEVAVFAVAVLLMLVAAVPMLWGEIHGAAPLRCALMVVCGILVPSIFAFMAPAESPLAEKCASLMALKPFPDDFLKVRDTLSAIGLKVWKSSPWLGTGLGTFSLDLRFNAVAADWTVISPMQTASLNGWWQLLMERGVIGCILLAGFVFLPLVPFVRKGIVTRCYFPWRPIHILGFVVMLALVAITFAGVSFFECEVLLAALPMIALSASAVPSKRME